MARHRGASPAASGRSRTSIVFLPPAFFDLAAERPPPSIPPFLPSLHQKTLRDLLLPVVIVFALIVLEVIIGEESLPAVPKLPAVDTACDPHPPGANVSRGAVCWYYPVRATHEHVVGYAPNNYASINALMADVLPRVADSAPRLHAEWTGELTMRGFETESALVEFYKTQARPISSHWSPYDPVGVVNADP